MFDTLALITFIAFHVFLGVMIAITIKDLWKEVAPYLNFPFMSPTARAEHQFFDRAEELRKLYEQTELDMRYPNRVPPKKRTLKEILEIISGAPTHKKKH